MNLLQMSLSAAMLITITGALRTVALHRLPKSAILLLWLGTLFILLNPLPVASPISVQHLWPAAPAGVGASDMAAGTPFAVKEVLTAITASSAAEGVSRWPLPLVAVWLAGALLLATYFAIGYLRSRRIVSSALPIHVPPSLAAVLRELRLPLRPIRLLTSDRIGSPAACGIFRPCILFPKGYDFDDQEQLRFVMTHELVHIKRLDTLWKLLMLVAVCVHWFNPLVWLMYVLLRRDLELACDERVLRELGPVHRSAYALSLLRMAERGGRMAATHSGFSADSDEERIVSIMKFKNMTVFTTVFALVAVIGVTTAFATTATQPADKTAVQAESVEVIDGISAPDEASVSIERVDETGAPVGETDEAYFQATAEMGPDGIVKVTVNGVQQELTEDEIARLGGTIIIKDENGQDAFTLTFEEDNKMLRLGEVTS